MGESRRSAFGLVVAIAALLAMAAVIWLPIIAPHSTADSPLPPPDAALTPLPTLVKIGLTVLFVSLGAGIGLGFILAYRSWRNRTAQ